jgi:hypothetical protein
MSFNKHSISQDVLPSYLELSSSARHIRVLKDGPRLGFLSVTEHQIPNAPLTAV